MATKTGSSNFVPALRDLVVALRDVDWHQLGTQLDVPQKELRRIDKECPEISRKLSEMLTYWMENEEPSWEKIVEALERIGCHGNLISELYSKYCAIPFVSSPAAVNNTDAADEEAYDRPQHTKQLQNQSTFKVSEPVVNGAQERLTTGFEVKQGHADSCMSIATQTENVNNEVSVKFASQNDKMKDFRYLIQLDLKEIKKRFITLQFEVRESLCKKVSHKKIVAHVLSDYEDVFENADCKTISLFSDADEEKLNFATSVDQVFQVLRKYWNFLKCEILYSIVDHCGDDTDQAKVKDYQEQLKSFFEKRKVSEVPKELMSSSSVDEMREKVLIKLDKQDPPWREITDLEFRICEILGIMPSVLLIIGVQEGCVEITFSIPKHISQLIFSKPLTREQEEHFREESILSLSCGHIHLTFHDNFAIISKHGGVLRYAMQKERKHIESDEEGITMLPHHTTERTTDQLSRFVSQHLGSFEQSARQHECACAGKNQLEEDLKTKSQEIKSELEALKCQTAPSYQISIAENRISTSEAEIKELKRRIEEVKSIIEDHEMKLRCSKSAIFFKVELLAEQLQTMKERREYEQAALQEAQHDQDVLQKKLLTVTRAKDEELKMLGKRYKTLLNVQRNKLIQEHREQEEMHEKMLHKIEEKYQKDLEARRAEIQDRKMQHVTELQCKNQKIEDLEVKIKKLEVQLSRRSTSTVGRKLRQWFRRTKNDIDDLSGTVLKDKLRGESRNLPPNSLLPISPTQEAQPGMQDQCSYTSTISPPLYDQCSLNSLPAMHFREIHDQNQSNILCTDYADQCRTLSQCTTAFDDLDKSEPEEDDDMTLVSVLDSRESAV